MQASLSSELSLRLTASPSLEEQRIQTMSARSAPTTTKNPLSSTMLTKWPNLLFKRNHQANSLTSLERMTMKMKATQVHSFLSQSHFSNNLPLNSSSHQHSFLSFSLLLFNSIKPHRSNQHSLSRTMTTPNTPTRTL